jgi:hypothetical protein
MHFATRPSLVEEATAQERRSSTGRCREKPAGKTEGPADGGIVHEERYSSHAVYPLEVCLLSQLCDNGARLFSFESGGVFECEFSQARLRALQATLLEE